MSSIWLTNHDVNVEFHDPSWTRVDNLSSELLEFEIFQ